MQATIEIADAQIRALDALDRKHQEQRDDLIRRAIDLYLSANPNSDAHDGFGLWGRQGIAGVNYQDRIRSEW